MRLRDCESISIALAADHSGRLVAFVDWIVQYRFFSSQGLATSPTVRATAQVGPVHFDKAESTPNGFSRFICERQINVPNDNFFGSRNRFGFSFGGIFGRVEWPSSTIISKYGSFVSAKPPRFRIQDPLIGKRLCDQGEQTTNFLCGDFSLVVTGDIKRSGHRNVPPSHVGETGTYRTEDRCRYGTAHNLLRELVCSTRLVSINAENYQAYNFENEGNAVDSAPEIFDDY